MMRYRTRLFISFLIATTLASGLSLMLLYQYSRYYLEAELRESILSVVTTAASLIDGDLHGTIRSPADAGSEAYEQIRDLLRQIRDANRRSALYVSYVYTLVPDAGDPATFRFVIDADEDPSVVSDIGKVYEYEGDPIDPSRAYVAPDFTRDEWGLWLSGFAPILNRDGERVGVVGVDVAASAIVADILPVLIAFLAAIVLSFALAALGAYMLSGRATRPLGALCGALGRVGSGDLDVRLEVQGDREFAAAAETLNSMVVGLREREVVKSAFARYVSKDVLDGITTSGELPVVSGVRRKITVLFCDIRDFTTLSERMQPEAVVQLLNDYLAAMVEVVFRNQGTLDKFLGDGIMVIFGAPTEDPFQEEHAVRTALEMQAELRRRSEEWEEQGRAPLRLGIGINSGTAVVGNVGSDQRLEYTAIGDVVNVASRIESATRELQCDILISDYTFNAVRGIFATRRVGSVSVKGRSEPVIVHAVTSAMPVEGGRVRSEGA